MSADPKETQDQRDLQIVQGIRRLPELEPPPALLSSVMETLQSKMPSWPRRLYLWAISPRSITFSPLRAAPAAFFLVAAIGTGAWLMASRDPGGSHVRQGDRLPVVFNIEFPEARSVSVIGTFNNWKTKGFELQLDKDRKVWSLTVLLPEGRHEYAFLVDGEKVVSDPGALFFQEDGFGQRNAVLILRKNNGENV